MLEKEYDESYDYIYWIDVGLAHPGLFLDRYNPYSDKADGMSRTWENYSYINSLTLTDGICQCQSFFIVFTT